MRDVAPAVVRVVDVPSGVTLGELHDLLQAALGWTDSHLHQFTADGVRYGVPDPDWDDLQVQDEAAVRLGDLPVRFEYLYDFGDGWEHDVEVLGPGAKTPGCIEGTGGCPPEDCGGPPGYEHCAQPMYSAQTAEFVDGCLAGRQPRPSGRDATAVMWVVDQAYRSAAPG